MLRVPDSLKRNVQQHVLPLVIVSISAVVLAMQGGTPFWHINSVLGKAKYAMLHLGNPNFFNYPALTFYLHGIVLAAYQIVLRVLPSGWSHLLGNWPYAEVPNHLLTAVFSVVAVLSTYGTGYLLTRSKYYAAIGPVLLISAPLWNVSAHFTTVDTPLAALCALTVFVLVSTVLAEGEIPTRHLAAIGILIGLAAAAKYNGAMIAMPVAGALLFRVKPLSSAIRCIAFCALCSIGSFLITNPYILIDHSGFVRDLSFEWHHAPRGGHGYSITGHDFHLTVSLFYGWGALLMGLSAVGAVALAATKELKPFTKMAVLVFPGLHLGMLLVTHLAFQRYAIPLLPFLSVFAMFAVFKIDEAAKGYFNAYHHRLAVLATTALLVAGLGINLVTSIRHNLLLRRTDTRAILQSVFTENNRAIEWSKVGAGQFGIDCLGVSPGVPLVENSGRLDVLVLDSFSYDRFLYDKSKVLKIDFAGVRNGRVVAFSPFDRQKEKVPFSPQSIYSPYFPDLPFRTMPGPFIEIYVANPSLAQSLSTSLARLGIASTTDDVQHGYYYRNMAGTETEIAQQGNARDLDSATPAGGRP